MCSQSTSYLPTLPVETLHHIFDELDAQTIVLGLARTCQRLRAVVKSYDRYRLNFQWLSKSDFKLMCHLVDPRDVISLTLSHVDRNLDHVELFLSLFKARRLSRLRTLKLSAIAEKQLKPILQSIPFQSVTSLSVDIGNTDGRRFNTTTKFLSSAFAQTKLCRLEVTFALQRLEKIRWSDQTQLEYLSIDESVDWDSLCEILAQLPRLRTLVLSDVGLPSSASRSPVLAQITSLTFTHANLFIGTLELMLSFMPSLNHFKLIGHGDYADGNRWEHFIEAKLPLLTKFEFFTKDSYGPRSTPASIESVVTSYRTPFWLEQKKWFVTCEYSTVNPATISLFTMPICVSSLKYESEATKVSVSTVDVSHESAVTMMDNVTTVQIDVSPRMVERVQPPVLISDETQFSDVPLEDYQRYQCYLRSVERVEVVNQIVYYI